MVVVLGSQKLSQTDFVIVKTLLLTTTNSRLRGQHEANITSQPVLAGTPGPELDDFVTAKFYCLHATPDGN